MAAYPLPVHAEISKGMALLENKSEAAGGEGIAINY
jgi:hypothetical protein